MQWDDEIDAVFGKVGDSQVNHDKIRDFMRDTWDRMNYYEQKKVVEIAAEQGDLSALYTVLQKTDTGWGLRKSERSYIWDAFYAAARSGQNLIVSGLLSDALLYAEQENSLMYNLFDELAQHGKLSTIILLTPHQNPGSYKSALDKVALRRGNAADVFEHFYSLLNDKDRRDVLKKWQEYEDRIPGAFSQKLAMFQNRLKHDDDKLFLTKATETLGLSKPLKKM